MNDLVVTPIDILICPYTLVLSDDERRGQGFKQTDVAKFIDIAFCVKDNETGEEFCTEPITYSMN